MAIFVDSSALIALLDADEERHAVVRAAWAKLTSEGELLPTSNYVVVETLSVLQRRFGMGAVHDLLDGLLPALEVHWIDEVRHDAALRALRATNRRVLSLVDLTSFELMRELGVRSALTIDRHFAEQGFETVPGADAVHETPAGYDPAPGASTGKMGAEAPHEPEVASGPVRGARPRRRRLR